MLKNISGLHGKLMSTEKSLGPLRLSQRMTSWKFKARKHRVAGDYARDNRNWVEAIAGYRAHLTRMPNDAPIWVQYGHALKESGAAVEAEAAYRRAVTLNPTDIDTLLHLGHLLKVQGQRHEAAQVFLKILAHAPNAEAVRELQQSGYGYQTLAAFGGRPKEVGANGIFLELSDLFQYLSHHSTVTGITRVTLGLINFILEEMSAQESARYHFVHLYGDGEGLMLVSREKMRRVVAAAMHGDPDLGMMRALISNIRSTSDVFRLVAGDTYLIVGAFWEFVANPSWIGGMRQRGVRIGAYIYDLIPISHRQYCTQELSDAFSLAFADTARLLDFALTISAFVAIEVRAYFDAFGIAQIPITPIPLAHALHFESRQDRLSGPTLITPVTAPRRQYLAGIPFVLCVCTIEARKNHDYLFTIWQRMIDAGIDVPDLVFVGRPGWRVEALMDRIKNSDYLGGRLHILNGLSDDELSDLYHRCLFTAFPSFVEGWGLPVGESLAHGKLCVASSASSIPEVGGDNVLYFDPFDIDDGYRVIAGLLADRDVFARREQRLRESFRPRTWNDVGRAFFSAVAGFLADLESDSVPRQMFAPRIQSGRILEVSKLLRLATQGSAYAFNPERLIFASGWRHVESDGTWMLDSSAMLVIATECAAGAEVAVILHLASSPWVGAQHVLAVSADGMSDAEPVVGYRRPLKPSSDFWVRLKGQVDDLGVLKVCLEVDGAIQTPGSESPVGVRVRAIGYAPLEDPDTHIALLERALLA